MMRELKDQFLAEEASETPCTIYVVEESGSRCSTKLITDSCYENILPKSPIVYFVRVHEFVESELASNSY